MTTLPQTAPIRVPRPVPAGSLPAHVGAALPLAGGGGGTPGGLTPADVLRVIRQNLWLIVLAVVVGGVGGYFLNDYLLKNYPKYKAFGYVAVRSANELPEPGRDAAALRPEEISLLQETHAKEIVQEMWFRDAIDRPDTKIRETDWFRSFESSPDPMAARRKSLRENLLAAPEPRARLVRVEMTAATPKDAKVIVEEITDVFVQSVKQRLAATGQFQVELMTKEKGRLQNDIDNLNLKLRSMEQQFGQNSVEISSSYNGKRMQLDALLQEQTRIKQKQAGLESQLKGMDQDVADGKTPAEVQQLLSRDGRYLQLKSQQDSIDIQLDQARLKSGPESDTVIALLKLKGGYQKKLDEIREELKSDYTESYRRSLQNELSAYAANQAAIVESIGSLNKDIGRLNEAMTEYRVLQEQERRLRDKVSSLDQEIRRTTYMRNALPWSQVEWSSRPQVPDVASFPKLWMTLPAAVMFTLALSLGIAFLRELTDTTVRSPRDIAKVGQLTLLGLIPHESDDPQLSGARLPLAIMDAPNSHVAEQFRQIRTRLQYAHSLDTTRSLLVTSPSPGDGKSTVACNLAASLALNGRRILLVDANFRRPTLHGTFNLPNESGFGDVLADLDRLPEAARPTDVPNLSLLPAGTRPANPTELLESQFFIDFVERALEEYDHVIFDSGPMLMVSESVAMAPRVDGVVTVVRARGNSRGLLSRLRDELRRVKAEHIGVVLNGVRSQGGGYYGRNIKSYYAYANT